MTHFQIVVDQVPGSNSDVLFFFFQTLVSISTIDLYDFVISLCLYATEVSLGLYYVVISLGLYDVSFLSMSL
jgi:hypothetical protein